MVNLGDFKLGTTLYHKFPTTAADTGAPTQLAGTPVVSVYEDDSTTEITAGITLTVDFDGRTGFNHLTIVASGANGYEVGKQYAATITTGTVGGTSAVGYVACVFSIEKAGLNLSNTTLSAGGVAALGYTDSGTLQSATGTTAVLRSAASFADDRLNGMTIVITGGTGVGQARVITDYVNSTDTATVDTWTTTPDNTSTYIIFSTPPVPATTVTNITGNLSGSVGSVAGAVGSIASGGITTASFAAGAINAAAIATDAIDADAIADNAINAAAIATGAITSAKFAAGAIDATAIASAALPASKFDAANPVPANIEQINTVAIVGNGVSPKFGV